MAAGARRGFAAAVVLIPAGLVLQRGVAGAAAGAAQHGGEQQQGGQTGVNE